MTRHSVDDRITALAPVPEQPDPEWAQAALARILADEPPPQPRRSARRRLSTIAVAGILTAGTGAAVAAATLDPIDAVRETLLGFGEEPNTTGDDIGTLHDPELVAEFRRDNGELFAFWIATTSSGEVCYAYSDARWDGVGAPTSSQLEYGCGGAVSDPSAPGEVIPLERPDQLGGFFKDEGEPVLYGVSPYRGAVQVHVQGVGVDRTLPLRADSLGYGAALPGATHAESLTLTFLDPAGRVLGGKTVVAPVG